jgi:hypothetical protein
MMLKTIFGMLVGGALGFAAYWFIGCTTGTCPLTSNPWVSTFLGLALGAMFGFKPNSPEQNTESNTTKHHEKQNKQNDN